MKISRRLAVVTVGIALTAASCSSAQRGISPTSTEPGTAGSGKATSTTASTAVAAPTSGAPPGSTVPTTAATVTTPETVPSASQTVFAAFVRGELIVLDVADGTKSDFGTFSNPTALAWSPDGALLAVADQSAVTLIDTATDQRTVVSIRASQLAWSASKVLGALDGATGELDLINPDGSRRSTVNAVESWAWAPDGKRLAVAVDSASRIEVLDATQPDVAAGGLTLDSPPASGPGGPQLTVAAWSPDGGAVLYWWQDLYSSSIAADGDQLRVHHLTTGSDVELTTTLLVHRWIQFIPHSNRFITVAGTGRFLTDAKTLQSCDVDHDQCSPLLGDATSVVADPAVSPDGRHITFVRAPSSDTDVWPDRELWIADIDGSNARPLTAPASGIAHPTWLDDQTIGYLTTHTRFGPAQADIIDATSAKTRTLAGGIDQAEPIDGLTTQDTYLDHVWQPAS